MRIIKVQGSNGDSNDFNFKLATHEEGVSASYNDWNTITNVLRIRKYEIENNKGKYPVIKERDKGFPYAFPFAFN